MLDTKTQKKLHKLETNGNDFLISQHKKPTEKWIRQIANRHKGIGCDQVLIITEPKNQSVECLFFNQDGSMAEMCLNGLYALAYFLHKKQKNAPWHIKTKQTSIYTEEKQNKILIHIKKQLIKMAESVQLSLTNQSSIKGKQINTGNQHLIIEEKNIDKFPLKEIGREIQSLNNFPNGINVSVTEKLACGNLKMRTYERGVGITNACGSAGLAVFSSLNPQKKQSLTIKQPGGHVIFTEKKESITMSANCNYIATILFTTESSQAQLEA